LAKLLCHVEKKFAKHIGPEEFVQCSQNLIKDQLNYDVPPPPQTASTSMSSSTTIITTTVPAPAAAVVVVPQDIQKKKTCNLENYFEWSNRLRLLVANEILQVYGH
jgi:hypothetical protein